MHHAAFTFAIGRGADEEIFGHLNLRWPKFFANFVTLVFSKNVATLYNYNFSLFDIVN